MGTGSWSRTGFGGQADLIKRGTSKPPWRSRGRPVNRTLFAHTEHHCTPALAIIAALQALLQGEVMAGRHHRVAHMECRAHGAGAPAAPGCIFNHEVAKLFLETCSIRAKRTFVLTCCNSSLHVAVRTLVYKLSMRTDASNHVHELNDARTRGRGFKDPTKMIFPFRRV